MPVNVELTEAETRCLRRYFERFDETENAYLHPEEYLAFQRIAGQVCDTRVLERSAECSRSFGFRPSLWGQDARSDSRRCFDEACGMAPAVRTLLAACIEAFETGDADAALELFAPDAYVFSPFLGYRPAGDFIRRVVGPGGSARLTLLDVLVNPEGRPQAVGYLLLGDLAVCEGRSDADVFHYVLNVDASKGVVRSMLVLAA